MKTALSGCYATAAANRFGTAEPIKKEFDLLERANQMLQRLPVYRRELLKMLKDFSRSLRRKYGDYATRIAVRKEIETKDRAELKSKS